MIIIVLVIIRTVFCIFFAFFTYYLCLPESGKRALPYIPMFCENQASFIEIQELVKNVGEDYYITNYPKSRSSIEIIKADSEISFHIVSTENTENIR